MKKISMPVLLMAIIFCCCSSEKHFISDSGYRNQVFKQFELRKSLAANREKQLFNVFNNDITSEQQEALKFLYAYMPLSDLADYDGEYFLQQVDLSLKARDTFSWGRQIPEDIFRHFVLPIRVNNENLDSSRKVFFNELKNRVKNLTIEEAALEVNHWCHEKVNYRPSDGRTSSPLASMTTSFGRCGEESTFTVAAMRSVGIPARQVYTPRWAHSDDNHAWVEVYVNDKWQYLGACEPEAVLNKGWFDAPVKRAMMVHTNVIGIYDKENVIDQTSLSTKINSLPSYTITRKLIVKVTDEAGIPVSDAKVEFKLYNYAEFYPLVVKNSDKNGFADIITGLGDLQVWASKDLKYGYSRVSVGLVDTAIVSINRVLGNPYTELIENIPPVEKIVQSVSSDKEAINKQRLAEEDSIRNGYMGTFMNKNQAVNLANEVKLDTARVSRLIALSYGNWKNISSFIEQYSSNPHVLHLLESVSEKDVRDISKEILEDHLLNEYSPIGFDDEIFNKYILSPRISNEMIRPWRNYLYKSFASKDGFSETDPTLLAQKIKQWVTDSITVNTNENYMNCPISPIGVYEMRVSDKHSRNIFFVAVCRSLSIPAQIDQATLQPQLFQQGAWKDIVFEQSKDVVRSAKITLISEGNAVKPEYYIHYTLQKFIDGSFKTLDYEGSDLVSEFPVTLDLEPGYYLLMTGNRKNDGSVIIRSDYFNLNAGEEVKMPVILQPFVDQKTVEGTLDMKLKISGIKGDGSTLQQLIGDKGLIISFIDQGSEPSRHLLNDIVPLKSELDNWGGLFLFVMPTKAKAVAMSKEILPDSIRIFTDENRTLINAVTDALKRDSSIQLPLVLFINSNGEITFSSSGYRIGTGENLLREMRK